VVVVWSEGEIEKEVRERMMEEGFTTREDGQGMGMGIVKDEIDKAGANISIENKGESEDRLTEYSQNYRS
jgi:nitrogen fixation/metabolism regulation signal transduction histidine kinase